MSVFSIPGVMVGQYIAGEDLSASEGYPVKLNSNGELVKCVADDQMLGVLVNNPSLGRSGAVDVNGVEPAIAGGAIAYGDELGINSSGQVITHTTGAKVGYAMSTASQAGDWITMKVHV